MDDGIVFERGAYIPVYGQIQDGCGYAAIIDTPYDARYNVTGEEIQPYFVTSLGHMRYARALLYSFFAEGDFNTVAKIYRAYLSERGEIVTLKEKMLRNPKVEYLIGCPVVHTGTAVHIHPASHFYDPDHPENNDYHCPFSETGRMLTELKKKGVEKAYLHLDGWGKQGYDNLHPDPFPVHEGAGGAAGMKALQETCTDLGYYFGIHDQYRDYYYDAPSFDLDNALMYLDGGHPYHDFWNGGPHTFLCAKLAMDYVRRNYNEFERLGIKLDGSSNLDELPTVPKKKQVISKIDPVIGIVIDIMFVILFLAAPHMLGAVNTQTGVIVPIFNVDVIRAHWYIIALFALFGIVRETVKLLEGRYNNKVMLTTVTTNVLSAGTAIWWLSDANLFNPAFTNVIVEHLEENEEAVVTLFEHFPRFFLVVMIFALALDTIEVVVKTLRK
jgi:hypothetical protein